MYTELYEIIKLSRLRTSTEIFNGVGASSYGAISANENYIRNWFYERKFIRKY